mgnify:CR=1 FL=1
MEKQIKIVEAHPEHLDKLVELYGCYRLFYEHEREPEKERSFLKQRMENNDSMIFLALDEYGSGMGFMQLYPLFSSVSMRRVWLLNDLYVDNIYRRRGVATALLDRAVEFGKSSGARHIMLETANDNFNAQKLYEKHGWESDDEFKHYFRKCD